MTVELIIGIAIGYIPCAFFLLSHSFHTTYSKICEVIDNFGLYFSPFFAYVAFDIGLIIAHIGGFVMGILVGTVLYPVISVTKRHRLLRWMFRLVAIPLAVLLFVFLIRNFYTGDPYAGQYVPYNLVN
jgi:hypothetical protein